MLGVLNAVVKDDFHCSMLQQLCAIQKPDNQHRKQVDQDKFGITR